MLSVTRERGQGAGEETGERAQECQTLTAMLFFKRKKGLSQRNGGREYVTTKQCKRRDTSASINDIYQRPSRVSALLQQTAPDSHQTCKQTSDKEQERRVYSWESRAQCEAAMCDVCHKLWGHTHTHTRSCKNMHTDTSEPQMKR